MNPLDYGEGHMWHYPERENCEQYWSIPVVVRIGHMQWQEGDEGNTREHQ